MQSNRPGGGRTRSGFRIPTTAFLVALLALYAVLPLRLAGQSAGVPAEVAKYIRDGESVVNVLELVYPDFPQFNITVYELSSGEVLVYSKYYRAVLLGDEWVGVEDGDRLALELFSLYAFEKLKPFKGLEEPMEFLEASYYWDRGVKVADSYKTFRALSIDLVKIAAAVAIFIVAPPAGPLAFTIFVISSATDLYTTIQSFLTKFKLGEKIPPRALLVMALLPESNDENYRSFYDTLNSLADDNARKSLEEIKKGVRITFSGGRMMSECGFMMLYVLAASNNEVLGALERTFGRDLVEAAGAFFITGGSKKVFREFTDLVINAWKGVPGARGMLGDFMLNKLGTGLKNVAVSAVIGMLADYVIRSSEDVDELMAFHAVNSILARDLARSLYTHSFKLATGSTPPTLSNMESFYYHKYLLCILLEEYSKNIYGIESGTLSKAPDELFDFWGLKKSDIKSNIWEKAWSGRINLYSQVANETLREGLSYTLSIFRMFEEYMESMSRRRKAPGPGGGIDVFLVIDVSGSMDDEFRGARKIDAAKAAARDFVNLVSPNDRIGLVKFSSTAELVLDLTGDKQRLRSSIDALSPGGRTALGDGLWLALDKLEARSERRPSAVVLLTDGMHNTGVHTPREAAERAKRLGVPVYTLGFGERGEIDEATLVQIAEVTGGRYFYAPSPEDLRSLYASLSQLVSGHLVSKTLMGVIKAGEHVSVPVDVEPGLPYFSIRVSYSGSKLTLAATRPDGVNVTGVESNVVLSEGPGFAHLTVYRPMSGRWEVRVVGVETPAGGTEYTAAVALPPISTSPHELTLEVRPSEVVAGRVKVSALRPLPSLEVRVSPTIEGVVSVSPSVISNLGEGQEVEVEVGVRAPPTARGVISGTLELRALDSVIFLPVRVIVRGTLTYTFAVNSSMLYEGEAARLFVTVFNDSGSYVSRATVRASVGGVEVRGVEVAPGSYELTLANLTPSDYTIAVSIEKSGYLSTTFTVRLLVTPLGDVNADGTVDYRDLALLVSSYGLPTIEAKPRTDINRDDAVDYRDLALLVANYGRTTGGQG